VTRHYVLTRSSYGPEWPVDANRRRLAITEGVTARMMRLQTTKDWSWLVLLDERDPLLEERLAVFQSAAPEVIPIFWEPDLDTAEMASWDKNARLFTGEMDDDQKRRSAKSRIAATAYKVPWADYLQPGPRLMTRLDDDDALARDSLARTAAAASQLRKRTVLMQPAGFRVWQGRYTSVRHFTNAMHTLYAPAGDSMTVYDYGHRKCDKVAPVRTVDMHPGWLWVRHPDTISGWKKADNPISTALKRLFPIDWSLV
jgi:hypothetical protein